MLDTLSFLAGLAAGLILAPVLDAAFRYMDRRHG